MAASVEGSLIPGFIAANSVYDQRDIYDKIYDRHREASLFDYLIVSGRTMKTDNTTFNWFEDDFLSSSITIETFTGTGAGVPIVVTIEEADHQESGTLSPGLQRDHVIVYTATGPVHGYVTAKSTAVDDAHTITIDPIDDTVDLGAAAAVADIIGIVSTSAGDGSGMPDSEIRKPLTLNNTTQIIKTKSELYGSTAADKVTFSHNGKHYFAYKIEADSDMRHRMRVDYALLLGPGGTKPDPTLTAQTAFFTKGVEKHIDDNGNTEPYTTNFALTDFENIIKYLDGQRAEKSHLMPVGVNLNLSIDKFAKGEFPSGGIVFNTWGNGNDKMSYVDWGFKYMEHGNFVFHKVKLDAFNYKPVTGVTDSPYPDMGFTIPLRRVRNPGMAQGGPSSYDSISVRYKAWDKEYRYMKTWVRDETITNDDKFEFNHKSEVGLMFPTSNEANKIEIA